MKKYKPKKWFTYARLLLIFGCVFLLGRTTNIVYEEISVKDNNEEKALSQNVINENKEEIYVEENPVLTKYISLPEKGFNLTLGNKTYQLYGSEYNTLVSVVASESHTNRDDILAVMSVILNRSDSRGKSPVEIVTAPGQFTGYLAGHYLKYLNEDGSLNMNKVSLVKEVVDDALNGLRNNNYYSFRSNGSVSYSDNQIVYMGNRYR